MALQADVVLETGQACEVVKEKLRKLRFKTDVRDTHGRTSRSSHQSLRQGGESSRSSRCRIAFSGSASVLLHLETRTHR